VEGAQAVNARDRIGHGPWQNAKGSHRQGRHELHGSNNLTKQTALDEKGEVVNGRSDSPNRHDILTAPPGWPRISARRGPDCGNWTKTPRGGHGRPPRPHGAERGAAGEVVEFVASVARPDAAAASDLRSTAATGCSTASPHTSVCPNGRRMR